MKEPRLIMGRSVLRYVLEGMVIIIGSSLLALWSVFSSLKLVNTYFESASLLEPLFVVNTIHYGGLFVGVGLFFLTLHTIKETLFKALEWDGKPVSAKLNKLLITPLIALVFLILPLTYAGHFLTKYQITQKGFYYCDSLRHKDRLRGSFVLEKEDCYDNKLQQIMLQQGKNNQLILEEARLYLLNKHRDQRTQAEQTVDSMDP